MEEARIIGLLIRLLKRLYKSEAKEFRTPF